MEERISSRVHSWKPTATSHVHPGSHTPVHNLRSDRGKTPAPAEGTARYPSCLGCTSMLLRRREHRSGNSCHVYLVTADRTADRTRIHHLPKTRYLRCASSLLAGSALCAGREAVIVQVLFVVRGLGTLMVEEVLFLGASRVFVKRLNG